MKTALITGISGQDGSYLAEYLLSHQYRIYGLVRRVPDSIRWLESIRDHVEFVYGDMRRPGRMRSIIWQLKCLFPRVGNARQRHLI